MLAALLLPGCVGCDRPDVAPQPPGEVATAEQALQSALTLTQDFGLVLPRPDLHTATPPPLVAASASRYIPAPIEPSIERGSAAKFVMRDGNASVFFVDSGFAIALAGVGPDGEPQARSKLEPGERHVAPDSAPKGVWAVQWDLVGARRVAPRPDGELPGKVNYFIGNEPSEWRTNLPTYSRVVYDDVYPGIDLVLEPARHAISYRFNVAAGADASGIRIRWRGVDRLRVAEDGKSLEATIGSHALREEGLHAYQAHDQQGLAARYVLKGVESEWTLAIVVDDAPRNQAWVLDPSLGWSYLGTNYSNGYDFAVGGLGNAYIVGSMFSSQAPLAPGFQVSHGGAWTDAFVTKLDEVGNVAWWSYLGGSGNDNGNGIAVDSTGNAYVTGSTDSTNFPSAGGFQTSISGSSQDAFVTKVNAAGSSLVWSSFLGGSGSDSGRNIAIDGAGNAYVTGSTDSSNFPSAGGFQTSFAGGTNDAFVTKVNAAGSTRVWSSFLGGSGSDGGAGIAIDGAGNAYVAGSTTSTNFPSTGGFQTSWGLGQTGSSDAFVTKVNAAGSTRAWSSYLGGSSNDVGNDIAVDGSGAAYVTGYTYSSDFPSSGGFQTSWGGGNVPDAFVTKVNPAGSTRAWSSYLGGSSYDYGFGVAVDGSGAAYVTGTTSSTDFPSGGGFQVAFGGGNRDAFVTKVTPGGSTRAWSSYVGGSNDNEGMGIAVDGAGNVYLLYGQAQYPRVTQVSDRVNGAPCSSGAGCASGKCVDNVCCNSSCNGGACDACSVATGAPTNGTCAILPSSTTCRGSAGECDAAENCTGSSAACPADDRKAADTACADDSNPCTRDVCNGTDAACTHPAGNAGASCRAAAGECDPSETCTGSSTTCPADAKKGANNACADDGLACTKDVCDGTAATCAHALQPSSFVCRASAGECDATENCTGSSAACPADDWKAADTACADDSNPCTRDVCNGTDAACTHPAGNAGASCRASAGECDPSETCTGSSTTCPADAKKSANTACADDGLACTKDVCDGTAATCAHPLQSSSFVCRASAGECDPSETCTGSAAACPTDAKTPAETACTDDGAPCSSDVCDGSSATCTHPPRASTYACRASAGGCDVAESCDGSASTCPADLQTDACEACADDANPCTRDLWNAARTVCQHLPGNAGATCRAAGGDCDVPETCSGTSATCPSDVKTTAGLACADDGFDCTRDVCDGDGVQCAHPPRNAGVSCRQASGECDVPEACDGVDPECPADARVAAETACEDDGFACTRDVCDGSGAACTHPAGNAGASCRDAGGECDPGEACDGVAPTCPADVRLGANAVCADEDNPCTEDRCDADSVHCTHVAGNADVECRAAEGECDVAERCTGDSASCPPDARAEVFTGCTSDDNPCTLDVCNGSDATCSHPPGNAGDICRESAGVCDQVELCDGSAICPKDVAKTDGERCGAGECRMGACEARDGGADAGDEPVGEDGGANDEPHSPFTLVGCSCGPTDGAGNLLLGLFGLFAGRRRRARRIG